MLQLFSTDKRHGEHLEVNLSFAEVIGVIGDLSCSQCRSGNAPKGKTILLNSHRESVGRFWIGKPVFPFEFPNNHTSISLSFAVTEMFACDRQLAG